MKVKAEIKARILAAADALAASGNETPTNDQVRESMGGGSLSHISPVMREWRASRKAEVVAALEMPADLKRTLETALGQVWNTASTLASASAETIRLDAEAKVKAADQERDEALTEIARLEQRIAQQDQALKQAREELAHERIKVATLERDNAVLCARIEQEHTEVLSRVNDKNEQIHNLKGELKEARNDNKALQAELVVIAKKLPR